MNLERGQKYLKRRWEGRENANVKNKGPEKRARRTKKKLKNTGADSSEDAY